MSISSPLRCYESRNGGRSGATLLELITVIVVLMMITSVTIPVVAPHVEGRRVREAARMVSTFINAGRNRAIETGRPAGVWIERMPNLPEASNMLYFAEIPQVYAGDYLDSQVETCVVGKQSSATSWPNTSDQEYYNIVIPRSRSGYNMDIWSIPPNANNPIGTHELVRERDLIKFEGVDRLYTLRIVNDLTVPNSSQRSWWYVLKGNNNSSSADGAYTNQVDIRLRYYIWWYGGQGEERVSDGQVVRTTTQPNRFNDTALRYQIYRQPIRLQAGSIRLPETVVIDLNFSSVTDDVISASGDPFHPRVTSSYIGNAVYPQDNTPIVFVFSPDGRMQRLYRQIKESTTSRWGWDSEEPFGNVYLLIGERRCVVPHETTNNYTEQIKKNWVNMNALWVRVNCQTGFTATALVDNLSTTAYVASPQSYLYLTRSKARAARVVGGR